MGLGRTLTATVGFLVTLALMLSGCTPSLGLLTPAVANGIRSIDYIHVTTITPNPIVSLGKPVYTSTGQHPALTSGQMNGHSLWRTHTFPSWVAIHLDAGPAKVLVAWYNNESYQFEDYLHGALGSYTLQVSADSTNGDDGKWLTVQSVSHNYYRVRERLIPFAGMSWVRIQISSAANGSWVGLDQISIFDASHGAQDTWVFLGDSITNVSFYATDPSQMTYAGAIHRMTRIYYPMVMNGGEDATTSAYARQHIWEWLRANPDVRFWVLGYGINDITSGVSTSTYEQNMESIIGAVVKMGRIPIVPQVVYTPLTTKIPAFNAVIQHLQQTDHLLPGPPLYRFFQDHPLLLRPDKLHPTAAGVGELNLMWGEAMYPYYRQTAGR